MQENNGTEQSDYIKNAIYTIRGVKVMRDSTLRKFMAIQQAVLTSK